MIEWGWPGPSSATCHGSVPSVRRSLRVRPWPSCSCKRDGTDERRRDTVQASVSTSALPRPSASSSMPRGNIQDQVREPTELGAEGVARTAARVVERLRERSGHELSGPVGIGVPGLVDVERGAVKHAVNLDLDGDGSQPRRPRRDGLGQPGQVENDVNVGALGAVARRASSDPAYLERRTGLAGRLVVEPPPLARSHGAAGEIGHVPVAPPAAPCLRSARLPGDSRVGSALAAPPGRAPGGRHSGAFRPAAAGEPRAIAVRDRFAAGRRRAIRIIGLTIDVQTVVLGGGVAQLGEPLR